MPDRNCDSCGKAPAQHLVTSVVRGRPLEVWLCGECAKIDGAEFAALLGDRFLHCARCGKDYGPEEQKTLLGRHPLPPELDADSFRAWESSLACEICGEIFFPPLPEHLLDFAKEYPLQAILRRRRPPSHPTGS